MNFTHADDEEMSVSVPLHYLLQTTQLILINFPIGSGFTFVRQTEICSRV